jgi:endonuclease IV
MSTFTIPLDLKHPLIISLGSEDYPASTEVIDQFAKELATAREMGAKGYVAFVTHHAVRFWECSPMAEDEIRMLRIGSDSDLTTDEDLAAVMEALNQSSPEDEPGILILNHAVQVDVVKIPKGPIVTPAKKQP